MPIYVRNNVLASRLVIWNIWNSRNTVYKNWWGQSLTVPYWSSAHPWLTHKGQTLVFIRHYFSKVELVILSNWQTIVCQFAKQYSFTFQISKSLLMSLWKSFILIAERLFTKSYISLVLREFWEQRQVVLLLDIIPYLKFLITIY